MVDVLTSNQTKEMITILSNDDAIPYMEKTAGMSDRLRIYYANMAISLNRKNILEAALKKLPDDAEDASKLDPNTKNSSGVTFLEQAISKNVRSEIVDLLLKKGADPNLEGSAMAPLHMTIRYYRKNLAFLLLADPRTDVNKQSAGTFPILIAIDLYEMFPQQAEQIINKLLERDDINVEVENSEQQNPLREASKVLPDQFIQKLLSKGANPNAVGKDNVNALYYAAENDKTNVIKMLLDKGANIDMPLTDGTTPLMIAAARNRIDAVKLLLQKGANKSLKDTRGQTAYDMTISDEIKTMLEDPSTLTQYEGKTKTDIDFFLLFLGKTDETFSEAQALYSIRNQALCPVCHSTEEFRNEACMYIHHKCKKNLRHEELYNKYKNDKGDIWWCVYCGRICSGHRHYQLGRAQDDKPALQPEMGFAFANSCDSSEEADKLADNKSNGGGYLTEKLKRVSRMIDYAFELQHFTGEITEKEARHELIEETWNGALMRMRYDPMKFKQWKTDLSVFKDAAPLVEVVPEAIPQPGDIDTPVVYDKDDGVESSLLDDPPIIEFKHKNKDGLMFNHVHGDDDKRFINKDSLITFMKTMGESMGKCYDTDCGGWLWPQEIEMAFNDPKLKDQVTEEDRTVLAAYKERFNSAKAPKTGGAKWKFRFTHELDDGECYLPPKNKKAGNKTRKNRKRARKTMRQK